MIAIEDIRSICSGTIELGFPLAPITSFKIGGPADLYVEPMSPFELLSLLMYFQKVHLPFLVIGNGSNMLVSDEGFRGAVINLEKGFSFVQIDQESVTAGAGIRLATFVDFCISHGFAGTEMLAGIPGTLGGGIIMNAGAYGGEISDHLVDITLIHDASVLVVKKDEAGFTYRASALQSDIILSARFTLPSGSIDDLRARRRELLMKRNAAQPTTFPNAGSIFKNPPSAYAAKLIEASGLKGFRIGGAEVSVLHANFIISKTRATAADILAVINHVRRQVFEQKGIVLALEILLVGFSSNALEPLTAQDSGYDLHNTRETPTP